MAVPAPEGPSNADELPALLAAARNGCPASLGRLLDAYRPYLLQIAGDELANDLQAKAGGSDLVQQTFLEAVQGFAGFEGSTTAELSTWLRQILRHNVVSFAHRYRSTARRAVGREEPLVGEGQQHEPTEAGPSPSSWFAAQEFAAAVEQAIGRLPEDYRRVVVLRQREGKTFEEIGTVLGRSAEAVRKLWFRAVETLQKELDAPE